MDHQGGLKNRSRRREEAEFSSELISAPLPGRLRRFLQFFNQLQVEHYMRGL